MTFSHLKTTLAVGALVLGLGLASATAVKAADNTTITATLTTLGVLDVQPVAQMNFGTWYIDNPPGDTSTLVKATTGGVTPNADTNSTLTEAVANTTPAQVTVAITGAGVDQNGTIVNVTRGVITNFGDTDAVLGDITYRTATQVGENALAEATPQPVTIVLGATPEPVFFGGTITITDAVTPNIAHTATFDVVFSY